MQNNCNKPKTLGIKKILWWSCKIYEHSPHHRKVMLVVANKATLQFYDNGSSVFEYLSGKERSKKKSFFINKIVLLYLFFIATLYLFPLFVYYTMRWIKKRKKSLYGMRKVTNSAKNSILKRWRRWRKKIKMVDARMESDDFWGWLVMQSIIFHDKRTVEQKGWRFICETFSYRQQ